jgi:hypothetical protein
VCIRRLSSEIGWDEILRQEFYLEWIDYIERDNPSLRAEPFETYVQNREQLSNIIKEHRKLVVQKIAIQIESKIVKPDLRRRREGRGKTQPTSYKEEEKEVKWIKLIHELGKKSRILPVRKIIESYQSIIFNIAPCWLASPEAT